MYFEQLIGLLLNFFSECNCINCGGVFFSKCYQLGSRFVLNFTRDTILDCASNFFNLGVFEVEVFFFSE